MLFRGYRNQSIRILRWHRAWTGALAAASVLCALAGCEVADAGPPAAGDEPAIATPALQDKASEVPAGCSRRWNTAKGDSALFCPDVRPPSPGGAPP
jgi:hypothetical protein